MKLTRGKSTNDKMIDRIFKLELHERIGKEDPEKDLVSSLGTRSVPR